jgi:hypothetical protein
MAKLSGNKGLDGRPELVALGYLDRGRVALKVGVDDPHGRPAQGDVHRRPAAHYRERERGIGDRRLVWKLPACGLATENTVGGQVSALEDCVTIRQADVLSGDLGPLEVRGGVGLAV